MKLFVDTSALFAAMEPNDRHHARAVTILNEPDTLKVTSVVVLAELWSMVQRRWSAAAADRITKSVVASGLSIEGVGEGDIRRAMEIGDDFPDQGFSLVDRTCFAVMLRLGLHTVATFDHHFAVFRFGPGRRKAFEIAR